MEENYTSKAFYRALVSFQYKALQHIAAASTKEEQLARMEKIVDEIKAFENAWGDCDGVLCDGVCLPPGSLC
jgi:hypothetical protein